MWATDSIRAFLDDLSSPVAICEGKGMLIYHNQAFERVRDLICMHNSKKVRSEWIKLLRKVGSGDKAYSKAYPIPLDDRQELSVYAMEYAQGAGRDYLLLITSTSTTVRDGTGTAAFKFPIDNFTLEGKIPSVKLPPEFNRLVGEDKGFKLTLLAAQRAAQTDFPVLLIGESGTGKEILAQTIHRTSRRSKFPFVDINCAAIPDSLIESELFGYDKGAFTGASREGRHGLFDEADGGSIFLDEIGDASFPTQSKLLRVLQEGLFKRVGGNRNIHVNVRHIAATNKDLTVLIKEGRFREDLFYRLNTITIKLPPLRERRGDISLLIDHFLEEHREKRKQEEKPRLSSESLRLMEAYDWPGNVRELKGVLDYAVTMSSGPTVTTDCLPSFMQGDNALSSKREPETEPMTLIPGHGSQDLATAIQRVEKELIQKALATCANKSEAIKALGISRRTFYQKLHQYRLD